MSKTYLFAGASSAIAEACAKNLQKKGHHGKIGKFNSA